MYTYSYDPNASVEYEEAFNWYQERSEMAADNFIKAVKDAIAAICKDPFRYRNTHKQLREIALKKYPYHLIYYVDENENNITITSLFHNKRNPDKKYGK